MLKRRDFILSAAVMAGTGSTLACPVPASSGADHGMIPDGATPWNGAVDENLTVEFTVPGIYGHICVPHHEWGMVGLIVVGNDFSNLKSVRKFRHPGSARQVFRALLKDLEATG